MENNNVSRDISTEIPKCEFESPDFCPHCPCGHCEKAVSYGLY